MSHLARALEHADVIVAHLECAKDEPEAPEQILSFLQASMRDITAILEHHDRVLQRYRRQHPPGGNP